MKALETDTGCRLLNKLGKKVVLTQAGEQLLHHASKVLQEMENARESLKRLGKWGQGRLRLGASTSACTTCYRLSCASLKRAFPNTPSPSNRRHPRPGLVAPAPAH